MNLYNNLYNNFKEFLENSEKYFQEISPYNIKEYNPSSINSSQFLHPKVLDDIKQNMKTEYNYIYKFDDVEINLSIIYDVYDKDRNNYLLFIINLIIFMLNKFDKQSRKLRLILIHSRLKKEKPKKNGEDLTSEHVNTGLTMVSEYNGEVMVYRAEEMTKVLIHELIHFYNFDKKNVNSSVEKDLNVYFNLMGKTITVNESFTDTFACLLNIIIYTLLQNKNNNYKTFLINFKKEQKFIINQAINILKYLGYKVSNKKIYNDKIVNEKTHIISYYVLKAANFNKIDSFINYLNKHNYHLDNAEEYVELLKNNLNDLISIIYNNKNANFNAQHLNSLRMTKIDIDLLHKLKLLKAKIIK